MAASDFDKDNDNDPQEIQEWKDALKGVFKAYGAQGADRVKYILSEIFGGVFAAY